MNQYLLTFINQFKQGFEYRGAFLLFTIMNLVSTIASIFLWVFIFNTTEISSTLTKDEIIVYFFLVNALVFFSSARVKLVSDAVRNGDISNILVKPTSVIKHYFAVGVGSALSRNLTQIPLNLFIAFGYAAWAGVNIELYNIIQFILIIPLIFLLNYSFFMIFGMLSFWTTDNSAFLQIITNFGNLLSGRWIPLFFLPTFIQNLLKFLPFQYFIYFPVMLILGKINFENYMLGILYMIIQILFFLILTNILYIRGIRRYEGYGM
jgi:ABC-2 type transport system permease protein